jgi:hypothetical protein
MTKGPALCAFNEAFKCKFTAVDMENVTQDRNKLNSSRVGEDGPVVVRVGAFELIAALFACPFLSGDFNLHEDVVVKTDPTEVRSDEASDAAANAAAKAEAPAEPAVRAAPNPGSRASRSRCRPARLVDEAVAGGEARPRKRAKQRQSKPNAVGDSGVETGAKSDDQTDLQTVYELDADEGVKFLKVVTLKDAKSLLEKVMESERAKRPGNAVDTTWTDLFFEFGTPRHTDELDTQYVYMQRKMGRYLGPSGLSWFGAMQGGHRVANKYLEIGIGIMPGGKQGFGVYARKDFVMKNDDVEYFQKTMKFSAYVLDEKLMRKEKLRIEEVLCITSTIDNGGLRSALVEGDATSNTRNESRIMFSHGGSLATLVNNGDAYAKIDYFPKINAETQKVDTENILVDKEFVSFLKNNPAIMNSIAKDTLIVEGSPDEVDHQERRTRQMSFTMMAGNVEQKYVGLRVPWYYAAPRVGEQFVKGEQVFASYAIEGESLSELDPADARFLGDIPNGGYRRPKPVST